MEHHIINYRRLIQYNSCKNGRWEKKRGEQDGRRKGDSGNIQHSSEIPTNIAWNNIDRDEETLSGKGISHWVNAVKCLSKAELRSTEYAYKAT